MTTKLKKIRELKNMTQRELAEKSGVHFRTLQYYEQGSRPIESCNLDKIVSLANVLDCKIEDIIENKDTILLLKKYEGR